MTTDLATPKVAMDRIDVVPGFNARKTFDKDELKELAETIKDTGIVQPVKVKQSEVTADNRRWLRIGKRHLAWGLPSSSSLLYVHLRS